MDACPATKDSMIEPFSSLLRRRGIDLLRGETTVLQINVGYRCNQVCRHCHLEAGPSRLETMDRATMDEVIAYARRGKFKITDITGGAPELNSNLEPLIEGLAAFSPRIMLRSNLTALTESGRDALIGLCKKHAVVLFGSLPSLNPSQAESQRGAGVWEKSISTLKKLNEAGYGRPGSGLELNLASNPSGAFLPMPQAQAEKRFHRELERKWGISFNRLYTFANVPLGRFLDWLVKSGNFENYMDKLAAIFNPCTVQGLMCRTQASVSWDGYLFDCDFNLAMGLYAGGRRVHVSDAEGPPEPGSPVVVSDHCYACTAGSGFT